MRTVYSDLMPKVHSAMSGTEQLKRFGLQESDWDRATVFKFFTSAVDIPALNHRLNNNISVFWGTNIAA